MARLRRQNCKRRHISHRHVRRGCGLPGVRGISKRNLVARCGASCLPVTRRSALPRCSPSCRRPSATGTRSLGSFAGRFAAERRNRRGLGKPETFNFLGFTFICGKNSCGKIPDQTENPRRPHAGEVAGDQAGDATAHAPAYSRTGQVAGAGCPRLLQLSRRADKWSGIGGVPASCHRPLAAHLTTSQSKGSDDVGADDGAGG